VGKGGKRYGFPLNTKSNLEYAQIVHSNATYVLRVHQFTTQQVGKGGKEQIFTHHTKSNLENE